MPTFYLAWTATPVTPPGSAPFEYLIHPMGPGPGDSTMFCTALIDAVTKDSAWQLATGHFLKAKLIYWELADKFRIESYCHVKQTGAVQIIPPRRS